MRKLLTLNIYMNKDYEDKLMRGEGEALNEFVILG